MMPLLLKLLYYLYVLLIVIGCLAGIWALFVFLKLMVKLIFRGFRF